LIRTLVVGIAMAAGVGSAWGSVICDGIYDQPASFTGTRTVGSVGLATSQPNWQDAVLSWVITDNGDNTLTYTYTFTGLNSPALSHFTLDLSDNAMEDEGVVMNPTLNGVPVQQIEFGDIDGIDGAVKFDTGVEGTNVFSFTSNRMPVWGDFFVKAGGGRNYSTLTNTGFNDHCSPDSGDFIARPDTVIIPEPATLGALMLGSIAMLRRRA
jgi:hypothetical protein